VSGDLWAEGTLGYERALEWKEPPLPEELAWCGWSVARAVGKPAARWVPLARIGGVRLHLCPPGTERAAAASFTEPLVAVKRGTPARGGYVGVDGHVLTPTFYRGSVPVPFPVLGRGPGRGQALRAAPSAPNSETPPRRRFRKLHVGKIPKPSLSIASDPLSRLRERVRGQALRAAPSVPNSEALSSTSAWRRGCG